MTRPAHQPARHPARRFVRGLARGLARLAGVLALAALAACALPPDADAPPDDPLAPYEAAVLPQPFDRLALDPGRDYVILAQVPAPVAYDMTTPETARAAFRQLLRQPWRLIREGTFYGHVITGWSCADGHRGLVAKTGADQSLFFGLLRAGWGAGAAFATYEGAHLVPLDGIDPGHLAILTEGRGHLLAIETTAAACAAMRGSLAAYLAHPARPAAVFSVAARPGDMEGDVCLTFALWLAGRGGAFGDMPALERVVPLNSAFIGQGTDLPDGVTPLTTARPASGPIRMGDLLARPWDSGDDLGRLRLADPELLFAGLTALRGAAGLPPGRHDRRALPAADPIVARARAAMLDWARGWEVWRLDRHGPLTAIILEHGPRAGN